MSWIFFDTVGLIAFAISGALVGLVRRMDIFGIAVLATITTVGGGITRDVLAGITPPTAFVHPTGIILALVTAAITSFLFAFVRISKKRKGLMHQIYIFSDSLGLAAFTVTGTIVGIRVVGAEQYVFPVMLAITTAVGGGIIRDLLAQRVPSVLKEDVYASAAMLGAIVLCYSWDRYGVDFASWACFLTVLGIRVAAIRYKWKLAAPRPRYTAPKKEADE